MLADVVAIIGALCRGSRLRFRWLRGGLAVVLPPAHAVLSLQALRTSFLGRWIAEVSRSLHPRPFRAAIGVE